MGIDARMLLRIKGDYTEEQTLELARRTFECFGDNVLFIDRHSGDKKHCITKVDEYYQDGETLHPREGETFLEVDLWGRYYGIDYERGHLPDYIMLAEFFEQLIPNVEVWYGGDSSGVCAEPFDRMTRYNLFKHFVENGHSPYNEYFDKEKDGMICERCNIQMIRHGWGQNYKAWYCKGCGEHVTERDGVIEYHGNKSGL